MLDLGSYVRRAGVREVVVAGVNFWLEDIEVEFEVEVIEAEEGKRALKIESFK